MKIIFTTHTYYPERNGVAVVNDYLTKGLHAKGYEVCVVTEADRSKNAVSCDEYEGIKIFRIFAGDKNKYIDFIRKEISSDDILINVCTQTPTTDFLLSELHNIKCRKKLLYVHGIWHFGWEKRNYSNVRNIVSKIYNNFKWRIYYQKYSNYIRQYDAVIQLHEYDEGNVYFKEKLKINSYIIENAVNDAFFEKADIKDNQFRTKYEINNEYLVCVSNYGRGKNQEMVLRAYYKSDCGYELIFIGNDDSGYIDYLKSVQNELERGIDISDARKKQKKVRFLRNIPREDIPFLVRNAFLFVFGSIGEKYPMCVAETMAAGVPFISTDVGVVKHFPGGLVVPNTHEGIEYMAESINFLVQEPETRKRLSREGRAYAEAHMRIAQKVNDLERMLY